MTDPVTASIVVLLGKYVVDKGMTLAKEVGPQAAEQAGKLLQKALAALRREPKGEVVADGFEEDPDTYAKPVEKELDKVMASDEALKAELIRLLAEFESTAQAHNPTYQATLTGSGAIAQGDGSTAIGAGGVQVKGSSSGPIVTGSGNTFNFGSSSFQSAEALPSSLTAVRDNLIAYFSKSELGGLAFEMGIRQEDLPGQTISELAQSLVLYCQQRGRVPELIQLGRRERPHVNWS